MPELNDTNVFENLNLTQTYVREIIRAELGFNQVVKVELINKNLNIYLKNGQSFVIPMEEPFINEYSSALMSLVGNLNNNNIANAYVNSEGLLTVILDNGLKIVSDFSYLNENINNITGRLENLTTQAKTDLVTSINEVSNKTKDILALYNKNVEAGAGINGWTDLLVQTYLGRTQRQKNDEIRSLVDYGAKGDGSTDDIDAINYAINDTPLNGEIRTVGKTYYVSKKPTNPLGKKLATDGKILMPAPQGGLVQLNSYGDIGKVIIGKEYMYRFWLRVKVGGTMTGHIFGDSTTATTANGGGYAGAGFEPQNLLKKMWANKGITNPIDIQNHGEGGTSVYQMQAMARLDTTNGSTDFFVIKYGINDAWRGLTQFATNLRSKLAEIRANPYGTVQNLTIFLVMPNATYDPEHGRASPWYEQLRGIYEQAARDYQCVLFDTYAYLRDVSWCAGTAMDNPFNNGQGVHPTALLQNQIWAGFTDAVIGQSETVMFIPDNTKDNGFANCTLKNNWQNYGGGFADATANKKNNTVMLCGTIKSGSTAIGTDILQMPSFAKPKFVQNFVAVTSGGFTTLRVMTDGTIHIADNNAKSDYISIDGISFDSF